MDAWPLYDLRLRGGDLELTPAREADALALADRMPLDLELDPAAPTYAFPETQDRAVHAVQSIARAVGNWRPEAWRIPFAVRLGGELIGLQELEASDFARVRTVDSSSWLVAELRGQGIGKQMRKAVLALAFRDLGAEAAVTSAWHDNHASLAVSRALGYLPNGEQLTPRGATGIDAMVYLRLTRPQWLTIHGDAADVIVVGLEPCLPLFGLA